MVVAKGGELVRRLAGLHWDGPVHGTVEERGLEGRFGGRVLDRSVRSVVTAQCLLIVRVTFVHFNRIYSRAARVGHWREGVVSSVPHQVIRISPSC